MISCGFFDALAGLDAAGYFLRGTSVRISCF